MRVSVVVHVSLIVRAALATATAVFLIFIVATRAFNTGSAAADYVALLVSLLLGTALIWRIPVRILMRLNLCATFAILTSVWLYAFGLGFVCSAYRDCL